MSVIAITGVGGYVGSACAQALQAAGHQVLPMGRKQSAAEGGIPFQLETASDCVFPEGVDVLIHCAWDLQQASWADIERVNVKGSMDLFDAAQRAGVGRILFISSMAAYAGCGSMYGRAKLLVEASTLEKGGVVIRPGTVWGDPLSGILGSVDGLVAKLPVVPMIGSGKQPLFCIHKDDLCAVVQHILEHPETSPDGPLSASHAEPIPFREIILQLARRRNRKVVLIPLPSVLIWFALRCAEALKLPLGLRSDSVTSLNSQNPDPDFSSMDALGIPLRHLLD